MAVKIDMEMPESCYLCRYHVNDICEIAGHTGLIMAQINSKP